MPMRLMNRPAEALIEACRAARRELKLARVVKRWSSLAVASSGLEQTSIGVPAGGGLTGWRGLLRAANGS